MFISQLNNTGIFHNNKIRGGYNYRQSATSNVSKSSNDIFIHSSKIFFGAGWSPEIERSIKACNIDEISQRLAKLDIETDFKDNKTVAWGCEKLIEITHQLNQRYGLKHSLPKGLFVEDFTKLEVGEQIFTICNWLPSIMYKGSEKVFPERTLFFDSNFDWERIDPITESFHRIGYLSSPHFLTLFIHDGIGHISHNEHLLKKLGYNKLSALLERITSRQYSDEYRRKYGKILSSISKKATDNPLESVAEDIARKISYALDPELNLTHNPFEASPYSNKRIFDFLEKSPKPATKEEKAERELLKKAWSGENLL